MNATICNPIETASQAAPKKTDCIAQNRTKGSFFSSTKNTTPPTNGRIAQMPAATFGATPLLSPGAAGSAVPAGAVSGAIGGGGGAGSGGGIEAEGGGGDGGEGGGFGGGMEAEGGGGDGGGGVDSSIACDQAMPQRRGEQANAVVRVSPKKELLFATSAALQLRQFLDASAANPGTISKTEDHAQQNHHQEDSGRKETDGQHGLKRSQRGVTSGRSHRQTDSRHQACDPEETRNAEAGATEIEERPFHPG
jgi:hypothetical protein